MTSAFNHHPRGLVPERALTGDTGAVLHRKLRAYGLAGRLNKALTRWSPSENYPVIENINRVRAADAKLALRLLPFGPSLGHCPRRRRPMTICQRAITATAVILVSLLGFAYPASAYSGSQAASYANTYAINRNTGWPQFSNDCTNFISQAMYSGGLQKRVGWMSSTTNSSLHTTSWTVASDSFDWVRLNVASVTSYLPASTGAFTPSWHLIGDPVYYDWENDGHIDHASINVAIGTDQTSTGWTGNLVDEHTTNRYKVIWNLRPYNAKYTITSFYVAHINPSAS